MTDAKFLFKKQEIESKRIARGSFNKKGGSRSKRCTLPSDRLTEKERKKLNGPCITYNLNKPMKASEFKAMPTDMAKKYLAKLAEEHGARSMDVAEMLGYSKGGFSNILHELYKGDSPFKDIRRHEVSREWLEFIGAIKPEDATEIAEPEQEIVEEVKLPEEKQLFVPECDFENISFNAVGDPLVIFSQLAKIIEHGKKYRVYLNLWPCDQSAKSLSNL